MLRFIVIYFIMFVGLSLPAQQKISIKAANADCRNAIPININSPLICDNPKAAGKVMDIRAKRYSLYYFNKEHYSAWFKFVVKQKGTLRFSIIPDKPTDDYDFILFECEKNNCCKAIKNKKMKPIRSNISRVNYSEKGRTGLGKNAQAKYVHEGKANNFSLPATLVPGKIYLLVVDNVYGGTGGFKINWNFEVMQLKPSSVKKKKEKRNINHILSLSIVDKATQKMINAKISIVSFDSLYHADTILQQNNSSLFLPLKIADYYEIIVSKPNYLKNKISFSMQADDSLLSKKIELQNIKVGTSFELHNVYFRGGSASFMGNSQLALRKLYYVLLNNPNLKVEIQGHVNLPRGSIHTHAESYYNNLSIARAKAVYNYLIKRGINADRLDYQGYGYSQMRFPNAHTQEQMAKNRRVEVKIIGN